MSNNPDDFYNEDQRQVHLDRLRQTEEEKDRRELS